MEYKKLMTSKVYGISEEMGVIVEVVEGKKNNVLVIHQQYKDDDGNWAYKGVRNGSTAIRLPLTTELASYLVDSIKSADAINTKILASKPIDTEVKTSKMSLEELKAMIAKLEAEKASKEVIKKGTEKEKKTDELELSFGDVSKMSKAEMTKLLKSIIK